MSRHYDALIVGTGHAGAQAAIALRQNGFTGTIGLIGEEVDLPYERPPLSKDYLAGDKSFERILIRPAEFWASKNIIMLLGCAVTAVDADAHRVTTSEGHTVSYDKLIWAAGGAARRLSCAGHDLAGVHSVRTRADVDRLASELSATSRIVVIGGGFIGLEATAVLSKLGKHVTIVEAQPRVLARVAGITLSRFYESEHRRHGVTIITDHAVDCIIGHHGAATGVRLADGQMLPADMVIVGIGIVPAIAPLAEAGAKVGNGVHVDAAGRTTLADVFAIGDCAAQENAFAGGARVRIESVPNAVAQATNAARTICSLPLIDQAPPWFWSNQFDLRLQTVGLSTGHDQELVRGDPNLSSFSVSYLANGTVIAVDSVNCTKEFIQARQVLSSQSDKIKMDDVKLSSLANFDDLSEIQLSN